MPISTTGLIVRVNNKEVGCLQSLGNISMKRNVNEYDCVNTDDVIQAVGKIKTDPIAMSVLFDPADTNGQGALKAAFEGNTPVPFEIELSDKPDGGTNGTKYTWSGAVISELTLEPQKDGYVVANFTATLNGKPTITPAA